MSKTEKHYKDLKYLFQGFIKEKKHTNLVNYLIANSNLPGRRANLEMANAFISVVKKYSEEYIDTIWNLCIKLSKTTDIEAPTNNPHEILPFCGTIGIGTIGSISESYYPRAIKLLKELTNDSRWRMHEAIRIAIQQILHEGNTDIWEILADWIDDNYWLQMRAVVASVAEPDILKGNQRNAIKALDFHSRIFDQIHNASDSNRKSQEFKRMKKGLSYTLSVVIAEIPEIGFNFLKNHIKTIDPDIKLILKNNLDKKRLQKVNAREVIALKKLLK